MDLQDKQELSLDEIFEEPGFANRLFCNARQLSDRFSQKSYLEFNIDESLDHYIKIEQIPLPRPLEPDQCHSIREQICDDTNHLDDLSQSEQGEARLQESLLEGLNADRNEEKPQKHNEEVRQCQVSRQMMEQIVEYLVENVGAVRVGLQDNFEIRFPGVLKNEMVLDLFEKFTRLKKTKEELVKYCMRKAFKFILQLPKNQHMLQINKQQKFSFSKCKNRFLKKISQEKSMNNKFLQQIFQQNGFSEDYLLFLQHFPRIMQEDNQKKVKYLAELLTVSKEGKVKSVEMVRRLPWTKTILERVHKISRELLKHSGPK